jgi:Uma2 family endonuclease
MLHLVDTRDLVDPRALQTERPRPLRRVEYDRLVELGCFEDERVELLGGALLTMSPQGPRHATVVERLTMLLVPAMLGRGTVRVQSPLAAGIHSEPEPDVVLVAPGPRPHGHPHTAFLVIEVAETSVAKDRVIKSCIYAACGVPEYWIVNLPENTIEIQTHSEHNVYREYRTAGRGETITLQALPDITLSVEEILG